MQGVDAELEKMEEGLDADVVVEMEDSARAVEDSVPESGTDSDSDLGLDTESIQRPDSDSSQRLDSGQDPEEERTVSPATRKSMQGNKRANTKPELLVRQKLRAAGYPGYRLQWKKVPGHPDIAYPGRKVAIFVNGCFWHHHEGCKYATTPKSNVEFWNAKFERNVNRDERNRIALEEMGWKVIVIWECELKKDKVDDTIGSVVKELRDIDEGIGARGGIRTHTSEDRGF